MLAPLTPPPTTTTSAVSAIGRPLTASRPARAGRPRRRSSTARRRCPPVRAPLPGDVPAGLSRLPHARPRRERPGVALRDRDEPEPESLPLREAPACRPPGGVHSATRG